MSVFNHIASVYVPDADIRAWSEERIIPTAGAACSSSEVYRNYCEWAIAKQRQPRSQRAVSNFLLRNGVKARRTTKERMFIGFGFAPI